MKGRFVSAVLAMVMTVGLVAGCGGSGQESWKVTCPWAPSGVAAMVSQKAAEKSTTHSENITLVAEPVASVYCAGMAAAGSAAWEKTFIVNLTGCFF